MPSTSCRFPEPVMDRLEAAAEERGAFQSELFRRAVRFYISENPDDIRAFTGSTARNQRGSPDVGDRPREAVEEAEVDVEEAEVDVGSGVYDPTEEF